MNLYLDTEFNGFGGELVSLAIVSDEEQFYEAIKYKESTHPWVKANVLPVLNKAPLMPVVFRQKFHEFVQQFKNPNVICDWHADGEHFCHLLAGNDYGSSLDFACTLTILKTPPGQPVSECPHNALSDAMALRKWYHRKFA